MNTQQVPHDCTYYRNIRNVFFIILLLQGCILPCVSQDKEQMTQIWDSLYKQYHSGAINDTQFLARGNGLLDKHILSPWMEENISLFRTILFSKKTYNRYRSEYFKQLGRNAVVFNNHGKSIFYYEQRDKELQNEEGFVPTLSGSRMDIFLTNKLNQNEKCKQSIEKLLPFIDSLPGLIDEGKIPIATLMNAHQILFIAVSLYQRLNDAARANEAYQIADNIYKAAVRKKNLFEEEDIALVENEMMFIEYERAKAKKDALNEEQLLRKRLLHSEASLKKGYYWAQLQGAQTHLYLAQFFFDRNMFDSVKIHSNLYRASMGPGYVQREEEVWNGKMMSEIEFKSSNYKAAYEHLLHVTKVNDSITNAKFFDMNNSSYAQVEAEYAKEQLRMAQRESENRNKWIATITVFSAVTILLIVLLIVKVKKRAQQMMILLRAENDLQIAEMVTKNSLSLFEEQQHLGMHLHDTIAGDLLSIKMFLGSIDVKAENLHQLDKLKEMIEDAYTNTRRLSHEWFNGIAENIEVGFLDKLNKITDKLIPADRYEKEIFIDPAVFTIMPGGFRVQLLHIIQEALYNIVKHAKASRISISLVKQADVITLIIVDNGVGFNIKKIKKGLGIESMEDRIKKIYGTMEINSDENGTELKFII